jgi:hypothetical protein
MARKFNLTVQDGGHSHGIGHVILDDMIDDLVVQEASHVLESSAINGNANIVLNGANLVIAAIIHEHGSGHVAVIPQWHDLTIPDAAHVVTDDPAKKVVPNWHMILGDGLLPAKLPTLFFSGSTGSRLNLGNGKFPALQFAGRDGLKCSLDLLLPSLQVSTTILCGAMINIDTHLPYPTCEGLFGARCNPQARLPQLEVDIEIGGDRIGRLQRTLPGLTIDATGRRDVLGHLDAYLPFLRLEVHTILDGDLSLDAYLSALQISAFSYGGAGATLDARLPTLRATAGTTTSGDILTLTVYLPVIIMRN